MSKGGAGALLTAIGAMRSCHGKLFKVRTPMPDPCLLKLRNDLDADANIQHSNLAAPQNGLYRAEGWGIDAIYQAHDW